MNWSSCCASPTVVFNNAFEKRKSIRIFRRRVPPEDVAEDDPSPRDNSNKDNGDDDLLPPETSSNRSAVDGFAVSSADDRRPATEINDPSRPIGAVSHRLPTEDLSASERDLASARGDGRRFRGIPEASNSRDVWPCLTAILDAQAPWFDEDVRAAASAKSATTTELVASVQCLIEEGRRHVVTRGALTRRDIADIRREFLAVESRARAEGGADHPDADRRGVAEEEDDAGAEDAIAHAPDGEETDDVAAVRTPKCAAGAFRDGGFDVDLDLLCHADFVACIFEHGADASVAERDHPGRPYQFASSLPLSQRMLSAAARLGRADCVEALLRRGVDPRVPHDSFDGTALIGAVREGRVEAAGAIMKSALGREIVDGLPRAAQTPLAVAAYNGDAAMVDLLISCGADVNRSASKGGGGGAPPLHFVVSRGSKAGVDVMRKIVEGGGGGGGHCDVDKEDSSRSTALHKVMTKAKKGMLRHLVNYGPDLNRVNANGFTPFRRAADRNLIDCCLFLARAGCDLSLAHEENWIRADDFPRSIRRTKRLKWFRRLVGAPSVLRTGFSLQLQCRRVIRRCVCRWDFHRRVDGLALPDSLKRFVTMEDDWNEVVDQCGEADDDEEEEEEEEDPNVFSSLP